MSFGGWVYPSSQRASVAATGLFLAILFVSVLLLSSCSTQRAWREQAMHLYCIPTAIEDTVGDSWRAQCPDGRVMHCSSVDTTSRAASCMEVH